MGSKKQHFLAWAAAIALSGSSVHAQDEPKLWSSSFSIDRVHGETLLALATVRQNKTHLIGELLFENNREGSLAAPIFINGTQHEGSFWPNVELEVGNELNGEWKTIGSSPNHRRSAKIAVFGGMSVMGLKVQLDAFQPFIGKWKFGRIILKSGQAEIFPLTDLAPPSSR